MKLRKKCKFKIILSLLIFIRTTSRKVLNADLVQIKAIKEIKKSYWLS